MPTNHFFDLPKKSINDSIIIVNLSYGAFNMSSNLPSLTFAMAQESDSKLVRTSGEARAYP